MGNMPNHSQIGASIEVAEKYKRILESNGLCGEVHQVVVKYSGLLGAGMASQQLYVIVKFENESIKPLNLFVKAHTSSPSHTEFLNELKAFENESQFFTQYVPAAKEFCKSKGHEELPDFYPKCFYGDENMIVFENLVVERGYTLLNIEDKQDMDAVRFGITNLAKHHAISYAFINELGGPEPFFARFPILDFEAFAQPACRAMMEPTMENGIKTSLQILERNDVVGKEKAMANLNSSIGKSYRMLMESIECSSQDEKKLFVLNHGDYWNNNMMFLKEKESNRIIAHMAIDFQITRYNSLGLDIGYYLFTSVKQSVRRTHWRQILEMYLTSFNDTSEKLGYPAHMSYEELLLTVRKKINCGFWISLGFTNEIAFAAFKDLNMTEMDDFGSFSHEINKRVQEWVDNNPDKGKQIAKDIVELLDEYYELLIT